MVEYREFNTVEKIARFTKLQVTTYRNYPSKKAEIAKILAPIFSEDAEGWKIVLDMGKFRNGFTRVLGVKGMRALKKLLYVVDETKYKAVDFGVDD